MPDSFPLRLRPALSAWGEPATTVGDEIAHGGVASRVWRADRAGFPVVIKLTFDAPPFVVPGLEVSAAIARHGIRTGPPLRTLDGRFGVEIRRDRAPSWTLAMLRFEPGKRLDPTSPAAPNLAATLLADVHLISATARLPDVPARTFDWFNTFLRADCPARRSLRRLRCAEGDLTQGVIYGDPSPEILLEPDAPPALIDWGTPSWGPLLYDAAVWARFVAGSREDRFEVFMNRYRQLSPVKPAEFDLLPDLIELASTTSNAI